MTITIRRAVAADAVSLAHLAEQTFRQAFEKDNSDADMTQHCESNFGSAIQRTEILDSNTVFVLAEHEGGLAGFAQLHVSSPKDCVPGKAPAELYRIYVLDDWHGRGVAQHLMKAVLENVVNNNRDVIWLGVWEHNAKAIRFYQKYGFGVVGEHVFQLGGDPQRDLILATEL